MNFLNIGAVERAIIDADIRHIQRALQYLIVQSNENPVLPLEYWRWRIEELMVTQHLSKAQFRQADALMVLLDKNVRASPSEGRTALKTRVQTQGGKRMARG